METITHQLKTKEEAWGVATGGRRRRPNKKTQRETAAMRVRFCVLIETAAAARPQFQLHGRHLKQIRNALEHNFSATEEEKVLNSLFRRFKYDLQGWNDVLIEQLKMLFSIEDVQHLLQLTTTPTDEALLFFLALLKEVQEHFFMEAHGYVKQGEATQKLKQLLSKDPTAGYLPLMEMMNERKKDAQAAKRWRSFYVFKDLTYLQSPKNPEEQALLLQSLNQAVQQQLSSSFSSSSSSSSSSFSSTSSSPPAPPAVPAPSSVHRRSCCIENYQEPVYEWNRSTCKQQLHRKLRSTSEKHCMKEWKRFRHCFSTREHMRRYLDQHVAELQLTGLRTVASLFNELKDWCKIKHFDRRASPSEMLEEKLRRIKFLIFQWPFLLELPDLLQKWDGSLNGGSFARHRFGALYAQSLAQLRSMVREEQQKTGAERMTRR